MWSLPLAEALTDKTAVKLHLGLTSTTDDDRINAAIDHASRLILDYIDRVILSTVYTEDLDGTGDSKLFLAEFPVLTSPAPTLNVDSTRTFAASTLKVLGTDWLIEYATGIIRLFPIGGRFARGIQNIRVVYSAGYATVPPSLANTAIEFSAFLFKNRGARGHAQASAGGLFIGSDMKGIPAAFRDQLEPWKRKEVDMPFWSPIET